MKDRILQTLKEKKIVIWEESARDGAQGKTIMDASDRIKVVRSSAAIFGESSIDHLVFAAGFPSICKEEFETIREVVDNVDNCYLAPNCRSMEPEVQLCIDSVKGAKYGRVAIVMPGSELLTQIMYHLPLIEGLKKNIEVVKYALDHSNGMPVDPQFTDITATEPEVLAEYINICHELGAATICLADSFSRFYPETTGVYLKKLKKHIHPDIQLYTHFHNDLGLALANNIEAVKNDVYLISTSWLGLGERNGLLATELFLFLMAFEEDKLQERFGFKHSDFFKTKPDLRKLYETAHLVSKITGIPLKVTDPIVGTGVNTISTGTPFINPIAFQTFDTEKVLGAKQKVYASHLANSRVIIKVAENIGFNVNKDETKLILTHIKSQAYKLRKAVFSDEEIKDLILKIRNA